MTYPQVGGNVTNGLLAVSVQKFSAWRSGADSALLVKHSSAGYVASSSKTFSASPVSPVVRKLKPCLYISGPRYLFEMRTGELPIRTIKSSEHSFLGEEQQL